MQPILFLGEILEVFHFDTSYQECILNCEALLTPLETSWALLYHPYLAPASNFDVNCIQQEHNQAVTSDYKASLGADGRH